MPGEASPPRFLVGPSRTGASPGTGWEPVSKLCVHPATPTRREGEAFLRPLQKGRLAWAPSRALHSSRLLLWLVLPFWSPVLCVWGVPSLGHGGRGPVSGLQLTASLPHPWAPPPCPWRTKGESLVPWGLAEAGATEGEGTQQSPLAALQSCLPGQGSSGTESPAPGGSPLPQAVSPSGCRSRIYALLS